MELQEKDNRIKYFEIKNSSVSVARNIGLENSSGEYIAFVDADDSIDINMIELLMEKAVSYDCDIVSCSYERIYTDKIVPEVTYVRPGYYNKQNIVNTIYPSMFSNKHLKQIIPMSMWTKLFRRTFIEEHKIRFKPGLKSGEDILFTQLSLLNAKSFYYIPEAKFYKYTFNESSVSNVFQEDKWNSLKDSIHQTETLIKEFPQYRMEKQTPYIWIRSTMTAIFNISKNPDYNKNKKLEELNKILHDDNLQVALSKADYSGFSSMRKILATLMKKKMAYIIYLLITTYPKL